MPRRIIGIVIHIGEVLDESQQMEIVGAIEAQPGIVSAAFTPGRPHFMLVGYDADALRAVDALRLVTDERVHARLVS